MRYLLVLVLATICGYGALQLNKLDPDNYVKMYLGSYVIEINVLGFLLLVLGIVLVLYFVLRLFRMLWKSPKTFARWRGRKVNERADQALGSGYLALIKGDWKYAEKRLTTKTEHSSLPYINYLAAAQAAQEQGKLEQRDTYLNAAYKEAPKERFAIGLVKAKLHQAAGQFDQALATLNDIADVGKKNVQFTAMLMQTYQQSSDWKSAQSLLPVARKQSALPVEVLDQIDNEIHSSALATAADKEAAWKSLPRNQRAQEKNIVEYANHLIAKGENVGAEKLIRGALKSIWSEDLVRLYGELESAKPNKLRRNVEGWLLARPENAELNLAAGTLAMREQNYELAKEYLQQAVQLGNLPKAYGLLGDVYEATDDSTKALQLYRAGVAALSGNSKQAALSFSESADDIAVNAADGGELIVKQDKSESS